MLRRIYRDSQSDIITVENDAGEQTLFGVAVLRSIHNDQPYTPPAMFDQMLRDHVRRTIGVELTPEDVERVRFLAGCLDTPNSDANVTVS